MESISFEVGLTILLWSSAAFLNACSAAHSSDPTKLVLSLSPETQLGVALTEINPKAFARAKKEVGGKMPGRLLIGLLKTKGWGRKMRTKKRGRSIYLRCEGARATATAYSRNVSAAAGRRAVRT